MSPTIRPPAGAADDDPATRTVDPRRTGMVLAAVLLGALAGPVLATVALGSPVDASVDRERPVLQVEDAVTEPGEPATVGVVLTDAPGGLAGFELTLEVDGAGTIRGAAYPDVFGLTTTPRVGTENRTVTVEAADLSNEIAAGATDVTIATVDVVGAEPGTMRLRVTDASLDADDGRPIESDSAAGTVTVVEEGDGESDDANGPPSEEPGDGPGQPPADDGDGTPADASVPGFAALVALAALTCIVALHAILAT